MTEFVLEDFEGPLDLLLTLITEERIDILDIPIAEITRQYNKIIEGWNEYDLDEVSEYLIMAARLIQIKSQMLLPRPKREQESIDPRIELSNQLLEYKAVRKIAAFFSECQENYSKSFTKDPEYFAETVLGTLPQVSLIDLERALRRLKSRDKENNESVLKIKQDRYTVSGQLKYIKKIIRKMPEISFRDLLSSRRELEEIVVTFLAVLELYKMGDVDFEQHDREIILNRRQN